MKNLVYLISALVLIYSCSPTKTTEMNNNPFFSDYGTPYEVPAFDKITSAHYLPAFKEGIKMHDVEISAIIANSENPTFQNTIEALDRSGSLLTKVSNVFFNLTSSLTNDTLQKIAKEVAPLLSQHRDNISLNIDLFIRVKSVYDNQSEFELNIEQQGLLTKIYKDFIRGGANLGEEQKEEFREINKELSVLTLKFGDNVLAETNNFKMVLDNKEDLAGLPQFVIDAAAEEAKGRDMEGKWLFTIQKPSLIPFLQYSEIREYREKMFKAYTNQGNHDDELDNKEAAKKIAGLRLRKANLLGFISHADFILDINMAKTPQNVYDRLDEVWEAALPKAKEEAIALQTMIDAEGGNFKLEAWDWWYYTEKLRKQKYALDDEILKPYFQLENVRQGMFDVVTKLYGIQFIERHDIPKYHPDVKTIEVQEADGSHIGILLQDFHPRASKRGGAWMSSYRKGYTNEEGWVTPIITMVMNFSKPTGDKPSLLTFEEVSTMFHEFGHVLHGMLTKCNYQKISGTSVARDFVELPSQIMENWAANPVVMKMYAKHYKTGEPIPDELITKIEESSYFNQGFVTVEYTAAAYLDMDWHTINEMVSGEAMDFENESMDRIGLIPEIVVRYRTPYFRHIFAGGYSSGYYGYLWAEVLDADAFEAFKETGIFNQETAARFREFILEKGGTEDPMKLYVKFRGQEPDIKPMLRRKGLL